jgi:hypothetical protein
MFLSYAKLLEQPDLPLAKLKKLPVQQRTGWLKLLTRGPAKRFLVCVNEKELRFRVADPGVRAGAAA